MALFRTEGLQLDLMRMQALLTHPIHGGHEKLTGTLAVAGYPGRSDIRSCGLRNDCPHLPDSPDYPDWGRNRKINAMFCSLLGETSLTVDKQILEH